jgi:hypothetical protein
VLDFGLAKFRQEVLEVGRTESQTESLSKEGHVLGTVPYMSPEQARRALIAEGVQAHLDRDHTKAIHVIIPQIEQALPATPHPHERVDPQDGTKRDDAVQEPQ